MLSSRFPISAFAFCLLLSPTAQAQDLSTRVLVLFDPVAGAVVRRAVQIADPEADLGLDFVWYPDEGEGTGLDAEGRINGHGRVVWRLEGLSAHDPRAWHHIYEGELRAGQFHGAGTLRWRDGREMSGQFAHGKLHGAGKSRDLHGNVTEARFANGLAEGPGVFRARDGWIWRGEFLAGRMHGRGEITEAGGQTFAAAMRDGVLQTPPPEYSEGHPLIGGLRPAQGGPSMADRARISVYVDQRLSSEQWEPYTDRVDGDEVLIYPQNDWIIDIWNGASRGLDPTLNLHMAEDWNATRALTIIDLASTDGKRVEIADFKLKVEASLPHLRPYVNIHSHVGCRAFQPSFHMVNNGWGAVENPRLRVRFAAPEDISFKAPQETKASTAWVDVPLTGFDEGRDIDIRGALQGLGVNTQALETARFSCPSLDRMHQCTADAARSGLFGQVAGFLEAGYSKLLRTGLIGEMTYDWRDASGKIKPETINFQTGISLGLIEVQGTLAECGDGGPWATEARRFLDVKLPHDARNYDVDLPIRGNRRVTSLDYGVKFWSERSALHVFQAEARFADGSTRLSPRTLLYFLNPRFPDFTSRLGTQACNISLEDSSMC